MEGAVRVPAQLGSLLRDRRRRLGKTQAGIGAGAGLKQATVSAFESDPSRATIETLFKLLSALELDLVLRDRATAPRKKVEW